MATEKRKCLQYRVDYLRFGFIESEADKQLPRCLLYHKKYFRTLKERYWMRPPMHSMFTSRSQRKDDGLPVSYNISLLMAKSRKPHNIWE